MFPFVRVGVIGIAALTLGACVITTRDPYVTYAGTAAAGNWRVERQVDPVTRVAESSALLVTRNSSHSSVLFPLPAVLQLTCFRNEPIVRLNFDVRVGSNRNSTLGYRFDENTGRDTKARFLQNSRTVVIEDRAEVAQFVSELASAKVLHIRIRTLNTGRTSAEFRVDGAPKAIEAAFAGCPLSNEPPRRTARRR